MNKVLKLLLEHENLNTSQMAEILGIQEKDIQEEFEKLKSEKILLGWHPILHPDTDAKNRVRAVIEVKITPERHGGFNRIAQRISRFDEVQSCCLMSGTYDLMVIVKGPTLPSVATFVSEKLATLQGVLSTSTHFLLRSYKEQGYCIDIDGKQSDKPVISP
jgi:DNA-binding Lrp family transcriptional regulator